MAINPAIRELFSAQVLANLNKSFHFKQATNGNYSGEIAGKGSVLRILSVPRPTRTSTTVGSLTYERWRPTAQSLVIDQDVNWAIEEDALEAKIQSIPLMEELARNGAYQLNDGVDQFLSLMFARDAAIILPAAQVGNGAADDKAYDQIVKIVTQMNIYFVPEEGRHIFVPFWFMQQLRLDPRFTGFGTSPSRQTIRGQVVDMVEGAMVHTTANCPGSTDTAIMGQTDTSATIIGAWEGATCYAEHIPPEGLVQIFPSAQNPNNFDELMRARHVFGAAVVHPDGIVKQLVTQGS